MPLATGNAAPTALLPDPDAAFGGSPTQAVLLFFYKSGCPASEVAAGVLPRFHAVPGLAIVAVSQDDAAETGAFAARYRWDGVTVVRDAEPWPASNAYDVRASPTWILLDGARRIAATLEGWSRDDANALAAAAARLVGAPASVVARPDGPEPAFRPG